MFGAFGLTGVDVCEFWALLQLQPLSQTSELKPRVLEFNWCTSTSKCECLSGYVSSAQALVPPSRLYTPAPAVSIRPGCLKIPSLMPAS